MENNILLWKESIDKTFDFETLIKSPRVQTIMGIPVVLDKILYDLTGETVIGATGTFVLRGIKVRGVWDSLGNVLHFKKTGILFNWKESFDKIFCGCQEEMFSIVIAKKDE